MFHTPPPGGGLYEENARLRTQVEGLHDQVLRLQEQRDALARELEVTPRQLSLEDDEYNSRVLTPDSMSSASTTHFSIHL